MACLNPSLEKIGPEKPYLAKKLSITCLKLLGNLKKFDREIFDPIHKPGLTWMPYFFAFTQKSTQNTQAILTEGWMGSRESCKCGKAFAKLCPENNFHFLPHRYLYIILGLFRLKLVIGSIFAIFWMIRRREIMSTFLGRLYVFSFSKNSRHNNKV